MPRGNAHTEDEIAEMIPGTGGLVRELAERLGCAWSTAKSYVDGSPRLQVLMHQESTRIIEIAESHIIEAIKAGDIALCKWYLRMKGQEKGYSMTTSIDVTKRHEITVFNVAGLSIPDAAQIADSDVIDAEITSEIADRIPANATD